MESTTMMIDMNGGNAEVARDEPNLENLERPNESFHSETTNSDNSTMFVAVKTETQTEINGDLQTSKVKKGTPVLRRKSRKIHENSVVNAEIDAKPHTRGQKRKLSGPDDISSEDSTEFNGFDSKVINNAEPGSHVLRKLIAEAESVETPLKRRRRATAKVLENAKNVEDKMDDSTDMDEKRHGFRSPEWDTDSVGMQNSADSELDQIRADQDSSAKSGNSSANSSPLGIGKLKVGKIVRGISPGGGKHKAVPDMSSPQFREPFKYGWKRELVFRAGSEQHAARRMADIYYYTPKGKKVRSFREVAESLHSRELSIDNFTFFKEPLGVNNPDFEIIRDARVRDSTGPAPTPPKKVFMKKAVAKRIVEKPLTPPPPVKVAAKSPKVTMPAFKIKLPAKKGQQKKAAAATSPAKSPAKEPVMLPPQWSSPAATRRSQTVVEKAPPPPPPPVPKPKRLQKPKLQEPCSIRCSSNMGLIPSLQCSLCLCLYHPECVGATDVSPTHEYICKNCDEEPEESQKSETTTPPPPPPPLIPISMIGGRASKSSKPQSSVGTPPKLEKMHKHESPKRRKLEKRGKNSSPKKHGKKDTVWSGNDFIRGQDSNMPKPAQNIALMAGKRYIVVPKNNAMAVQPAITAKSEKIGDKAPIASDNANLPDTKAENLPALSTKCESMTEAIMRDPKDEETKGEEEEEEEEDAMEFTEITEKIDDKLDRREIIEDYETSGLRETIDSPEIAVKPENIIAIPTDGNEREKDDVAKLISALTDESPIVDETSTAVLTEMEVETEKNNIAANNSRSITEESTANQSIGLETNIFATNTVELPAVNKKKATALEADQRHFMVSVCAGYAALSRIFQYLKVQELLRAARVCKMWRDLAAHPNLWKTVRMKNSQVTDWDGLADSLKRYGTQHLDLRKMLVAGESDGIWKKFVTVIPRVTSLVKLELCRCPVMVVEEVIKSCPQLQILSAMSIKCDSLNLESIGNLKSCRELRLKALSGMSLHGDLTPLRELTQLTHLSLTSVKELAKKNIEVLGSLVNLENVELGECSDFPDKFGTEVLLKLQKLERLRLEKGQGTCCTFDILDGVSKLERLNQLELVNFDVKNGFDKCLSNCKNIKRLLIIPTYISQSATSNNMVLGGVTELSNNLTHFVWGVTLELLRVTELFVDQCNQMNKQVTGDSIPVLKPVPCLKLIEDGDDNSDVHKDDKPQQNLTNPQVDILPLPQLQKLLLTALPKTRVKILKIPFHATWRQSILDTATQ